MYGPNTNPLVPLTGFGTPAGAAILAGYPVVAVLITVTGALATAALLWRSHAKRSRNM